MNRWVLGARPRTLPAAVVPVLVGTACAWGAASGGEWFFVSPGARLEPRTGGPGFPWVDWVNLAMAMLVALALQVATNYANDHSDGKRGTDDPTKRVGPPRLVGNGLATPGEVKRAMLVAFGVALVAGSVLVLRVGWELVPVGIAAVAAGYFYTGGPRPYGYAGFGELFVFTFFGVVATVGSTYVQLPTRSCTDPPDLLGRGVCHAVVDHWDRVFWLSVGCSVIVGCFATALLVVNNLRDIPGDTESGKRTLAVRLGDRRTRYLYAALVVLPFLVLPPVAGLCGRPVAAIAFIGVVALSKPLVAVLGGVEGHALIPVLGQTGRLQLVTGVLLAVGLVVSTYV